MAERRRRRPHGAGASRAQGPQPATLRAAPPAAHHIGLAVAVRAKATMNKSVTGIFADRSTAELATANLLAVGFRRQQVAILDASNLGRRSWIAIRIANTKRAMLLGAMLGGIGGAIAGSMLGTSGGKVALLSLVAGVMLAGGGAALGTLVGKSTARQVQAELEHQVDAGRVLVSVTTDDAHAALLGSILARGGSPYVVSTRTGSIAATLAGNPD